jgi:N-acetylglucosamine-6-phosphate deacetylase
MLPPPATAVATRCLFDGYRLRTEPLVVEMASGRIVGVAPAPATPTAGLRQLPEDALLAPGFVDLQVNGGGGVLFNDVPDVAGLAAIAAAHRRGGSTALLATLITDTRDKIAAACDAVRGAIDTAVPGIRGIHLEGPFLNPLRKGAHRGDLIRPPIAADVSLLDGLGGSGATLVTVAPEMAPAGFIRALTDRGIRVNAGHCEASEADMQAARDEGLAGITHLFNAMPPISARAGGPAGYALAGNGLVAGVIADGLHVSPTLLRLAFRALGPEGLCLVTDAMPSVGAADAAFDLMGRRVTLRDGRLTLPDGTLAGAHLTMAEAVRNAQHLMGASLAEALAMATRVPADYIGATDIGRIAPGARADLVALDSAGEVLDTWIGGAPALAPGAFAH